MNQLANENGARHQRGRLTWKYFWGWVVCALVAELLAASLGLSYGSSSFGIARIFDVLLGGDALTSSERMILWFARFPRVCFAAVVGGALASAGVVFQSLLRNPLADPYILGVSGGGALCATMYIALGGMLWMGVWGLPASAMAGALLTVVGLLLASRWIGGGKMGVYALLLLGVVFNAFASAVITLFKAIMSAQKAQELLFYLMGSLSVEGTPLGVIVGVSVVVLGALGVMMYYANDLNVLALGDETAASLGVEVERVRLVSVVAASIAVAVAVAYTGLIGFVGLIVPHGLRLIVGSDCRLLIPLSFLFGGVFLLLSDVVARAGFEVFSMTLPVGVVTALCGAPVFVWLLRRSFLTRRGIA